VEETEDPCDECCIDHLCVRRNCRLFGGCRATAGARYNTLTLKYKDGEKTIVVPSDAIVVNLIPGDKADLKPGAKIFIPAWAKSANGTMEAAVALVGRDGLTPPM
jgi:hypothetical protein